MAEFTMPMSKLKGKLAIHEMIQHPLSTPLSFHLNILHSSNTETSTATPKSFLFPATHARVHPASTQGGVSKADTWNGGTYCDFGNGVEMFACAWWL